MTANRSLLSCGLLLIAGGWSATAAYAAEPQQAEQPADSRDLLRYGLQIGQELTYISAYDFVYDESVIKRLNSLRAGDGFGEQGMTTIWIVGHEDTGRRAVLRASSTSYARRGGQVEEQKPDFKVMSFVVSDTGEIFSDDPGAQDYRIEDYFPRLPDDTKAARDGWRSENPRLGRSYRLSRAAVEDGRADSWALQIEVDDSMNRVVSASQTGRATFKLRLLATFTAEYKQAYGIVGRGTQTLRLKSVTRLDAGQLAQIQNDAQCLGDARRAAEDDLRRAREATSGEMVERLLAQSPATFEVARKSIQSDIFREPLDSLAAAQKNQLSAEIGNAEHRGKILGTAAPKWQFSDLRGTEYKSGDELGKVVVLDFWYRACGPCMEAMPQIKQLSRQFANRPVAVFGVNTDKNRDDPAFVAEKLGLEFPVLLAGDGALMTACGGTAFPTLVIIDQKGMIRYVHTGYAADLAKTAADVIEALLKQE